MIFITHPEHGADNISESDLAEREKSGWKVMIRADWMGAKAAPSGEVVEVVRNKPGRKPKAM